MIRRAFTMRLKKGSLAEYKRYHDNIWPELVAEIEKSGIGTMTIFENDPVLFLYSEIYDEKAWDKLWHTKIHDKWGELMNPLMHFGPDGIVDSTQVREVFHLDTNAAKKPAAKSTAKVAAKSSAKAESTAKTAAKTTGKTAAKKPAAKATAKTTRSTKTGK